MTRYLVIIAVLISGCDEGAKLERLQADESRASLSVLYQADRVDSLVKENRPLYAKHWKHVHGEESFGPDQWGDETWKALQFGHLFADSLDSKADSAEIDDYMVRFRAVYDSLKSAQTEHALAQRKLNKFMRGD